MPLLDFSNTGRVTVTVSNRSARLLFHGCNESYIRDTCHGRCCWVVGSDGKPYTLIYVEPDQRADIVEAGGTIDQNGHIATASDGRCPFQYDSGLCRLHDCHNKAGYPIKPRSCWISPWIITDRNKLIIRNRYKMLRCYRAGGDTSIPAYRAFISGLRVLLGGVQAHKLVDYLDSGGMADYQVQVPRDRYSLVRGVMSTWRASYYAELTPVEQRQGLWFKRDDYAAGGLGAKARAIEAIINANKPVQCVHTGGSRHSVQIVVAATVCKRLGVPLTCHVPTGQTTAETRAVVATGAKLVRHKPGYSSVLRKRAADYARAEGGLYVPPGLDSAIAVGLVAKQAANIPDSVERVVVCGGSGITAAGILLGTKGKGVTVVVIEVGASTRALIGKHAGCEAVRARILPPTTQYEKPHAVTTLYGVPLDPYYEAKCIPYVKNALEDEMLWVSANRVPQVQA